MRGLCVILHRYIGLATALFLVLLGLTGSVLAWREPVSAWLAPEPHEAPARGPVLTPELAVMALSGVYFNLNQELFMPALRTVATVSAEPFDSVPPAPDSTRRRRVCELAQCPSHVRSVWSPLQGRAVSAGAGGRRIVGDRRSHLVAQAPEPSRHASPKTRPFRCAGPCSTLTCGVALPRRGHLAHGCADWRVP
jgi:hypothetical protein